VPLERVMLTPPPSSTGGWNVSRLQGAAAAAAAAAGSSSSQQLGSIGAPRVILCVPAAAVRTQQLVLEGVGPGAAGDGPPTTRVFVRTEASDGHKVTYSTCRDRCFFSDAFFP
jgi:hypothetical protein